MLKKLLASIVIGSAFAVANPIVDMPFSVSVAKAADIYAGNMDGYEIYVRTETVKKGNNDVAVATKSVCNGTWIEGETWYFINYKEEWRYETEMMKRAAERKGIPRHTCRVTSGGLADNILRIALSE